MADMLCDYCKNMLCDYCKKQGCSIMTEKIETKGLNFYCCLKCADSAIHLERFSKGFIFMMKEIEAFSNLRDSIKAEKNSDWNRTLPFVYGWLMFYLALKKRDTPSRLKRLFQIALKKNQEIFSDIDGDKEFKEENPRLMFALTKYLVKNNQDIAGEFIDLFATPDS